MGFGAGSFCPGSLIFLAAEGGWSWVSSTVSEMFARLQVLCWTLIHLHQRLCQLCPVTGHPLTDEVLQAQWSDKKCGIGIQTGPLIPHSLYHASAFLLRLLSAPLKTRAGGWQCLADRRPHEAPERALGVKDQLTSALEWQFSALQKNPFSTNK